MTFIDIVAILGALAWAPHVIQWISNAVRKPKLEVVFAQTVWLGFTNGGPFFNISLSLSSKNKDVIVTKIGVRVHHQSGENRELIWNRITEEVVDFNVPSIEGIQFKRNLYVLAIKAVVNTLAERNIVFFDENFYRESRAKLTAAIERFNVLQGKTKTASKAMMASNEYDDIHKFLTENLFWREGKYTFEMIFEGKQLREPHIAKFAVNISRSDFELIQKNIENVKLCLEYTVLKEERSFNWQHVQVDILPTE